MLETALLILWEVLSDETTWNMVTTGIVAAFGYGLNRVVKNEALRARAKDVIAAGVNDIYPTVKQLKDGNPDGKLTPDQRLAMQNRAIDRAQEIAQNTGIDLLKVLGPSVVRAVMEQAVTSLKHKEIKLSPGVINMLPDVPARSEPVVLTPLVSTGHLSLSDEDVQRVVAALAESLKGQPDANSPASTTH